MGLRGLLKYVYLGMALAGAALCLPETFHYAGLGLSYIDANVKFWSDMFVNHATRSILWDIVVMYFASCAFMLVEGKRLNMKVPWAYCIGGYLTAIAFTFPLFLFFRELKMEREDS